MSQASIEKTYDTGAILTEADLDNIKSGYENFPNNIKLDNDNIQNSGISGTLKIVNSSVTTAKINDSAVTTAKINDSAVTTVKINDSAVTTVKIDNNGITRAKLTSANIQTSFVDGLITVNSPTYVDVGVSVTITPTGRPTLISIIGNEAGGIQGSIYEDLTSLQYGAIAIYRDEVPIAHWGFGRSVGSSNPDYVVYYPLNFITLDTISLSGSRTYTVRIRRAQGSTGTVKIRGRLTLTALEI